MSDALIHLLANNPLVLLFLVSAIGYPLGRVAAAHPRDDRAEPARQIEGPQRDSTRARAS